ncbi:MAG: DUF4007 family protein [Sphaerochaetaceae bacterium]
MKIRLKAHQTFSIRMGWLYKGLNNIIEDTENTGKPSTIFIDKTGMVRLGIGSNMVKSLRYWMVATGLTSENISGTNKGQISTEFGNLVYENDKHFEKIGTLILCHYNLINSIENATSWYYFFNEYSPKEFTKEDICLEEENWLKGFTQNPPVNSVESDIDCLVKLYCSTIESINNYEDNKVSPFVNLELIKKSINKNQFFKSSPNIDNIPSEVAMFIILKQLEASNFENKSILNFEWLIIKPNSLSKVLNLQVEELIRLITKLEKEGFLRFIKTAGLEQIIINEKIKSSEEMLIKYYKRVKNER